MRRQWEALVGKIRRHLKFWFISEV